MCFSLKKVSFVLKQPMFDCSCSSVVEDVGSSLDLNSDIVSFRVRETISVLDPPARITFQHFDVSAFFL